jgi:hypothetical protein
MSTHERFRAMPIRSFEYRITLPQHGELVGSCATLSALALIGLCPPVGPCTNMESTRPQWVERYLAELLIAPDDEELARRSIAARQG